MKVLFDHLQPFLLAHGGVQVQIEQTRKALEAIGVEVEYVRWWDPDQKGDLIHYFSIARSDYLQQAIVNKIPVVMTVTLSQPCNRPLWRLRLQGKIIRTLLRLPVGEGIKQQLSWRSYPKCDRLVVGLNAERAVLEEVFGIPRSSVSVVPLGLPDAFQDVSPSDRKGDHLINTGTIRDIKGSLRLAELAQEAKVPILFVGNPYHPTDPYWREFQSRIDKKYVRYEPHVNDVSEMIRLLKSARGFALLSDYENWSLSASEAAACGLPLILPDLPWSRERFGDQVHYLDPKTPNTQADALREFYEQAPNLSPPNTPFPSWIDVAKKLKAVYESVLK